MSLIAARSLRCNRVWNIKHIVVGMTCLRNSSFKSSEFFNGYDKHPNVEIVKNPPEWFHVEALLSHKVVPTPSPKSEYLSVWKPQTVSKATYNYMIYRNKNQMMPVYLKETHRGLRKLTIIKRIDGNIWELHDELKSFVERTTNKEVLTKVNELSSQIQLRGDFVQIVYDYLLKKGF